MLLCRRSQKPGLAYIPHEERKDRDMHMAWCVKKESLGCMCLASHCDIRTPFHCFPAHFQLLICTKKWNIWDIYVIKISQNAHAEGVWEVCLSSCLPTRVSTLPFPAHMAGHLALLWTHNTCTRALLVCSDWALSRWAGENTWWRGETVSLLQLSETWWII